ncbi:MAG: TonB-dependent receptor [Pseudomonadota bacterium]
MVCVLEPGRCADYLQGSSVRPDVSADRSVASLYAELLLPLLRDVPGANSLDVQLAARYEDFDDVGSITRPKIAVSWYPIEQIQIRASYSEGFRAPNLIQLNSPATSITTSVDDYAEGILLGSGDIDDGPSNGNYILETSGNRALQPEESENVSLGVVFTPTDNFTLTVDWWKIETTGTVGVFSDENESRLDAVLRSQGSSNPRVIRAAPDADNPLGEILMIQRAFENLNERTVSGFDIGAFYNLDTAIGGFDFQLNLAKLKEFDQEPGGNAAILVNFGADPTVLGASVGDLIQREFFPEWRATASLRWNSVDDNWGAALFARYVDEVFEPTVTNSDDDFYFLDTHTTFDLSITRRNLIGEDSTIRLAINNLFDEDPPLAREAFGFEGELHSSRGRYFSITLSKVFN